MGSRSDDDYWNTKYAEAECHKHEGSDMCYDDEEGEWLCDDCQSEAVELDDLTRIYKHG
jgi:hypothetical protein